MPCIVDISPNEEINHFQVMLCKACKYLTKPQIESLSNPGSGMCDGIEWYKNHLFLDFCSNNDSHEKAVALNELYRMGYDVFVNGPSLELKKK